MNSPFPGMDPFLEDPAVWEEFHHVFITECMYHLGERLPAGYVAKIQERTQAISVADEAAKEYVPDVAVARSRRAAPGPETTGAGGGAAVAVRTATIPLAESTEVREGFVEIRRLVDHELVTCVEVLSPWNKFGEGIGIYREKRRTLVARGVHVVELDLLLRGTRTELADPLPPGHYFALVFRSDRRPDVDVFAWQLGDRLPTIPVPLRPPDEDVPLALAAVFTTVYERARYDRKVRYTGDVPKGVPADDAEWVQGLLRARRGREG